MMVRKVWRLRFALTTAGVAAVAIACGPGFLDGISGGAATTEPVPDATTDATPAVDARACERNLAPEPPPPTESQLAVLVPTFAFDTLRVDTFGAPDAGGALPVGLDLDDRCTCPEEDSCVRAVEGDAGRTCDGRRGEDNAMAAFFNSVNRSVPGFEQAFATNRIQRGHSSFLVEILGWNGEPNDSQVTVTLRTALELQAPAIDGDAGAGFGPPKFDGTDIWRVDAKGVSGGVEALGADCRDPKKSLACLARTRDDDAYVRDGVVVARLRFDRLATASVPLYVSAGLGPLDFDVFDMTLLGRLERKEDGSYSRLTGELTGRISASNMLTTIAGLRDFTTPTAQTPTCENAAFFAVVRSQVCGTPDLAAPGQDNRGAKCDHLSLAMAFSAVPATVGEIARRDPVPLPCGTSHACP